MFASRCQPPARLSNAGCKHPWPEEVSYCFLTRKEMSGFKVPVPQFWIKSGSEFYKIQKIGEGEVLFLCFTTYYFLSGYVGKRFNFAIENRNSRFGLMKTDKTV